MPVSKEEKRLYAQKNRDEERQRRAGLTEEELAKDPKVLKVRQQTQKRTTKWRNKKKGASTKASQHLEATGTISSGTPQEAGVSASERKNPQEYIDGLRAQILRQLKHNRNQREQETDAVSKHFQNNQKQRTKELKVLYSLWDAATKEIRQPDENKAADIKLLRALAAQVQSSDESSVESSDETKVQSSDDESSV